MIYVETTLQKEGERVSECLDISTKQRLVKILEEEIIDKFKDKTLDNEEFEKFIVE